MCIRIILFDILEPVTVQRYNMYVIVRYIRFSHFVEDSRNRNVYLTGSGRWC
jgi:hypothetical protein